MSYSARQKLLRYMCQRKPLLTEDKRLSHAKWSARKKIFFEALYGSQLLWAVQCFKKYFSIEIFFFLLNIKKNTIFHLVYLKYVKYFCPLYLSLSENEVITKTQLSSELFSYSILLIESPEIFSIIWPQYKDEVRVLFFSTANRNFIVLLFHI